MPARLRRRPASAPAGPAAAAQLPQLQPSCPAAAAALQLCVPAHSMHGVGKGPCLHKQHVGLLGRCASMGLAWDRGKGAEAASAKAGCPQPQALQLQLQLQKPHPSKQASRVLDGRLRMSRGAVDPQDAPLQLYSAQLAAAPPPVFAPAVRRLSEVLCLLCLEAGDASVLWACHCQARSFVLQQHNGPALPCKDCLVLSCLAI